MHDLIYGHRDNDLKIHIETVLKSLSPCPLCGNKKLYIDNNGIPDYFIECNSCGLILRDNERMEVDNTQYHHKASLNSIQKKWNKRHNIPVENIVPQMFFSSDDYLYLFSKIDEIQKLYGDRVIVVTSIHPMTFGYWIEDISKSNLINRHNKVYSSKSIPYLKNAILSEIELAKSERRIPKFIW